MSDAAGPQEQAGRQPTPEEFAAALADRLARTPVRDVVFQCIATFIDMATIRLGHGPAGPQVKDMTQAKQAIEAARALVAVAERELGPAQVRPFREPLAALQMAYARSVEEGGDGAEAAGPGDGAAAQRPQPGAGPARPDAASRLWVPPGTQR